MKSRLLLPAIAALLIQNLAQAQSPNIVLLLSDDQGWTGTSLQMDQRVENSSSDLYRTPNLERLAADGTETELQESPASTRTSMSTSRSTCRCRSRIFPKKRSRSLNS